MINNPVKIKNAEKRIDNTRKVMMDHDERLSDEHFIFNKYISERERVV